MKAVIYTRVSKNDQSTQRQIKELKDVVGFQVVEVFSESISGFSKSMRERKGLQDALAYIKDHDIKIIMLSEISRLGRNTHEVLNLIKELEDQGIEIYIHNLAITLKKEDVYSKLVVTIMADLARMESETMSMRIKSGIKNRKAQGLHTGRKIDSHEDKDKFLSKHPDIIKCIKKGYSIREAASLTKSSTTTVQKVKKYL